MSVLNSMKSGKYQCSAVIVAAGSSRRFGDEDKLLINMAGAPVLAYCLRTFNRCEYISEIVVVADSEKIESIAHLVDDISADKVTKVVCGGATRLESALSGLAETDPSSKLVAIHDGARPLVTEALIKDIIENAKVYKAAIPAVPVKDTIKLVRGGMVRKTPNRSELVAVQTPQVFDRGLINAALTKAFTEKISVTDDASAVEALGKKVKVCDGDENNIKITTPTDLKLAEEIVKAGGYRF